ncbi:DUF6478 family protein [Roseovarius ramblicola]|uniref:DUF6478 family protein n=1 Tax=Roseovarius ramblicola TaxID=2022336 RepID=A0ABV5I415_9RHOB
MKLLDTVLHRRAVRVWRRAAQEAPGMSLDELRRLRSRSARLSHFVQEARAVAEHRLALPVVGSTAFPRPHGTDWSWRPEIWRLPLPVPGMASAQSRAMMGREVTLFHDCSRSELSLRQVRNTREADLAPYGLRMDSFAFDGSFLSLVIDLPQEAVEGLTKRHLIRLDTIVELEKPLDIFARLNIRHGPNTEQIVRELPLTTQENTVEFDLAYSSINEKRIERGWIDLIFETPAMSQVTLRDVTFSRRPRAAL